MDDARIATSKFTVGQPVRRSEDPKLLCGEGRYTDDLHLPSQAYAVFVRSTYGHGRLTGIDRDVARDMPGVLGIYTADDMSAGGIGLMPSASGTNRDGMPSVAPPQTPLASSRVRYTGDPVAIVVAETLQQARDTAEAVMLAVDDLPAITSAASAAAPDAPSLHDEVRGNVAHDFHYGDAEAVRAAFAAAHHVTQLEIDSSRIVVCPMEPRAAIGEFSGARWTLRTGSQGVFGLRGLLAGVLNASPKDVRVLTGNVGGSFGMKVSCYPEYVAVLFAARELERPVKWTDERSQSFVSDSHGRYHQGTAELALDSEGRFLAVRITSFANVGAYLFFYYLFTS